MHDGALVPLLLPVSRKLLRDFIIVDHEEPVAGLRHFGKPENLYRSRGTRFLEPVSEVIGHRPHAADEMTDDDGFTDPQRALLDEHRRDRPAGLRPLPFHPPAPPRFCPVPLLLPT